MNKTPALHPNHLSPGTMFFNKIKTTIAVVTLATSVSLSTFAKDCRITDDALWVSCQSQLPFTEILIAFLSDCQYLIANYPSTPNFGSLCHYTLQGQFQDTFNTMCYGACKCSAWNCHCLTDITLTWLQVVSIQTRMVSLGTWLYRVHKWCCPTVQGLPWSTGAHSYPVEVVWLPFIWVTGMAVVDVFTINE